MALFVSAARGHIRNHPRYVEGSGKKLPLPILAGWPAGRLAPGRRNQHRRGHLGRSRCPDDRAVPRSRRRRVPPVLELDRRSRAKDPRVQLLPRRLVAGRRARALRAVRCRWACALCADRSGPHHPLAGSRHTSGVSVAIAGCAGPTRFPRDHDARAAIRQTTSEKVKAWWRPAANGPEISSGRTHGR